MLGCGGGKSVIEGMIAKATTDNAKQVLFLVHRQELCEQIRNTFMACDVNLELCNIAMVQTTVRRLDKIAKPDLIITDECHHANANSYIKIYNHFPEALKIGFTATPVRMNEGGLGKVFDCLVQSVSTKWLIANKHLAPYKYYSVKLADVEGIKTKQGDYDREQIAELMDSKYIYGETIKNWQEIAAGKQTIVYCASVKSSMETAKAFCEQGISARHIDGSTEQKKRTEIVQGFRDGKITVLCNVDLFGEGFDVPDCECVVLLRPTKSLTIYIQQSMRSMRYKPNKTAIIIDHVGNVYRHNFPDADREWDLKSKKRKEQSIVKIKECPACFSCLPGASVICKYCGHIFKPRERSEKEILDAKLEELKELPHYEYKKAKTFDDLVLFQKSKKYKFLWVLRKAQELNIAIPDKYKFLAERL